MAQCVGIWFANERSQMSMAPHTSSSELSSELGAGRRDDRVRAGVGSGFEESPSKGSGHCASRAVLPCSVTARRRSAISSALSGSATPPPAAVLAICQQEL